MITAASWRPLRKLRKHLRHVRAQLLPLANKRSSEFKYWKRKQTENDHLHNAFYEWLYTTYFGLTPEFYAGKRVLDVGCGPRGSLEWAHMARERVGVDPLARKYRKLGADAHAMRYVNAGAESIPLPDQHFDVVAAFNSLDHVEDVNPAIAEIKRLTKPGGLFLLIVEVNHPPTNTEPLTLQWNIVDRFRDCFELIEQRSYEVGDHRLYRQLRREVLYDHSDPSDRPALIAAKFRKVDDATAALEPRRYEAGANRSMGDR
jgi:ubiquinone/menaquinone biosynthesis C-methylase UbiE